MLYEVHGVKVSTEDCGSSGEGSSPSEPPLCCCSLKIIIHATVAQFGRGDGLRIRAIRVRIPSVVHKVQ